MELLSHFSEKELYAINLITKECENKNIKVYLVGGVVRDYLLNVNSKDIDICIEDNPIEIVKNMDYILDYKYYEKFQTCTIKFINGVVIDLVRCRKEKYEYHGALPRITPSSIYDDLYRRDFTINAMAYDIINNRIIDPFKGIEDLKKKCIRKVHFGSYKEDPTRIYRAVKYASRYNFEIYDKEEILDSIKENVFKNISNDRIIKEILSICREESWINCILLCNKLKLLNVDTNLLNKKNIFLDYAKINDRIIHLFFALEKEEQKDMFINNSILEKKIRATFKNFKDLNMKLKELLNNNTDNYQIYRLLNRFKDDDMKLFGFNMQYKYLLKNYQENLKNISLELKESNFKLLPVKDYNKVYKYALEKKLNSGIFDERKFILKQLGEILNVTEHKD